MPRKSSKYSVLRTNCVEQCKHIISELLLTKETALTQNGGEEGQLRKETAFAQNSGEEGQESIPLFSKEIIGLPECNMERFKHALHDVYTILNDDVDEILGHLLAIPEFGSEKLLSSHANGTYEERITPPSAKKQKPVTLSVPDAYEKVDGYLGSEIFEQITRDIEAIEKSCETRQEAVKKLSDGLLPKLCEMAQGVDGLLDAVASECRPMTTTEKLELGKRIRKLPEKALDHMVEIVTTRTPENHSSEKVSFNMEKLDNATLWRLYFYVENALQASKI